MAPRVTILILVGIIIYVSLSLYHWRQIKKIPGKDTQKGVESVLIKDSHEKNWVQVSTTPGDGAKNNKNIVAQAPTEIPSQNLDQQTTSDTSHSSQSVSAKIKTPTHTSKKDLQVVGDEIDKLRDTIEKERKLNKQQSEKNKVLHAQVIRLQSALEEATDHLKEKERALDEQKKISSSYDNKKKESAYDVEKIQSLKKSLGSKIEAIVRANAKITGLSERLDQSTRTIEDLQSSNTHLQGMLAETEADKLDAQNKNKIFQEELIQVRDEKERYLAEIGQMHTELQQTKTHLARLENELSSMELKTQALLRYGQQQTELITPFRQEIEILHARVDDKKVELLKSEDQINQLQDINDSQQKEIITLQLEQQKNVNISNELKKISLDFEKGKNHSYKLSEQLKVLADQLENRDEIISSFQKNLAHANDALRQSEKQINILQGKNNQQQQQLEKSALAENELHQEFDRAEADLLKMKKELSQAQTEKDQLSKKLADHEQLLVKTKAENTQLSLHLEETKKHLTATIEQQKAALSSDQDAEQVAINDQDKKEILAGPENTIEELKIALQEAKTRLAETEPELQQLKQSLAEAEKAQTDDHKNQKLQYEIDQLRNTLAGNEQQKQNMVKLVADLEGKNSKLQEKIHKAKNSLKNIEHVESVINQKDSDLHNKQEKIVQLQDEAINLKTELDRRETDYFKMQEEYTSLQDRLVSIQQERDALLLHTIDSDNDGVSDAEDNCPETIAKVKVGADGCELDRDQDGLADRLDLCPDSSGQTAINSLGCADGESIILSGLYFSGGNAELSEASQEYLDGVTAVLERSKEVQLEVSGHTDSIGDIRWNKILSLKRAEAVARYLSEKGIDDSRLFSIGYGSERPIADNEIAAGRSANRRVELRIVVPSEKSSEDNNETITGTGEEAGSQAQ